MRIDEGSNQYESQVNDWKKGDAMKTENLMKGCPQRNSTECEEYVEVSSIDLPKDGEREHSCSADHLMEEISSIPNMKEAMKRVRRNGGAAGVDGMKIPEAMDWLTTHFAEVQGELLGGYYHPTPVRRRVIPKPDGGERKLGIPTVKDRVVQQAITQVLVPLYEPQFAENSYGYRPGRSGQQAIMKVKEYAEEGYSWAVVLDLSKYFDTLSHDRLIRELRKTIKDETLMGLIKKFLKAGVMENGVVIETNLGSPQGGNLSPLLANIYLNEFDQEYARRGVPEIRYADDIVLLAKSKRAAERILEGSVGILEGKLKLKVNREKSKIVNLAFNSGRFKYLGFGMGKRKDGHYHIYAHAKSKKKFKEKLKAMTNKTRPGKFADICKEVKQAATGWINYYKVAELGSWLKQLDQWLRTRMRMIIWKRWKKPRTKLRKLRALGIPEYYAFMAANTRKGTCRAVHLSTVTRALSNKRLEEWGYLSVSKYFESNRPKHPAVQLQFAF